MDEIKTGNGRIQFRIELILALIITGLACCAGFSNYLFTSNDLYPLTSDAMGHMAKVRYLAESFARGEFPAWFPYWYNGSTVAQYYPPFSYWLMVPMFLLTQNAMLTFKIDCFLMIFIGGMGVWYFCKSFIGRWCGLFGSVLFCLQPYILLTFFAAGLLAQGPVIALTPWYLTSLLAYGQNPNARRFIPCTLLCAVMILSHPMTIFMICLCIVIVFFLFVILKKITIQCYCYIIMSMVFAGFLTAFWSLVGVTQLETPGIPYLLVESALNYTANLKWFLTLSSSFFFFAIPVSIGSVAAVLLFAYSASKKKACKDEWYYIFFCIILTLFTVLFSFGLNLPLFEYLPLAESLVPGRILGLTSVSGAILCAYLVYEIQVSAKEKKVNIKISAFLFCMFIIGTTLYFMNPFKAQYLTISEDSHNEMFLKNHITSSRFEKGRYASIGSIDSSETYMPLTQDFNITAGWNIEGTPHNLALWSQPIVHATNNFEYIAKDFAFWNVRSICIVENYNKVLEELNKKYPFELKSKINERYFYVCDTKPSYFLIDNRNALIFGIGAPGIAMEFPYLIHGQRNDISDYSLDELQYYRLIYICEPEVDTVQEKKNIETTIEALVNKGVTVIIEPTTTKGLPLFDVTTADVISEDSPTIKKQKDSPIEGTVDNVKVEKDMSNCRVLFGLDKAYYKLIQNDGRLENDVVGTKKVGNGEVIFIGMHMSQYLKAVYARNWGVPLSEGGYPRCSDEVKALFADIFKTYGVNSNFWPDPFPVKNADWNYKGVNFEYSIQKAQEMTLSVTYTPRWKATLDGKPIAVGQKENLITLNLPAGEHEVKLVYGLTKYGIAGYAISLAGLLLFILFLKFYDILLNYIKQICIKIDKFLQLDYAE